ncbi:hypothetical protein Taro_046445 [Colocasia esculenta]|uniref:Uncharacterized protein n=1 Tax=Colocasia esculenta TaxID=4460 RepID=A0A843X7E5_COLES|nr:hypothetical protein [Colocasia esculenta]
MRIGGGIGGFVRRPQWLTASTNGLIDGHPLGGRCRGSLASLRLPFKEWREGGVLNLVLDHPSSVTLPLFGVDACKRAACRARGGAADVWSVKATPEAVAIRVFSSSTQLGKELLRLCWASWHFGEVLDVLSTRGRREEWGKCRAMLD